MTHSKLKLKWTLAGVLTLSLFPYIVEAVTGGLVTMPFYFLIILWTLGSGVGFLVFPLFYLIYTPLIAASNKFGKITLIAATTFVILNIVYMLANDFNCGFIQAIISLSTSFIALSFSYFGWKDNSINIQYAANLVLFFLLSWSAFPISMDKGL